MSWRKRKTIELNKRCEKCKKLLGYRNISGFCRNCMCIKRNQNLEFYERRKKRIVSQEIRDKLSKRMMGKNNPNYRGGVTRQRGKHICDRKLKEWRRSVFEHDKYICCECGVHTYKGLGVRIWLEAHHIFDWKDFPEYRYEVWNGRTLCKKCHRKITNKQASCTHSVLEKWFKCGQCHEIVNI